MKKLKKLLVVSVLTIGLLASNVVLAEHENPGPKPPNRPGPDMMMVVDLNEF